METALEQYDPQIYELTRQEAARQSGSIRLIPSENYVSRAVMQATGSAARFHLRSPRRLIRISVISPHEPTTAETRDSGTVSPVSEAMICGFDLGTFKV